MTSKRKAMKRQVRWSYITLLKCSEPISVNELIKFYNEYDCFRNKILKSRVAPSSLKVSLPPIIKPQYVNWLENFVINEEKNDT